MSIGVTGPWVGDKGLSVEAPVGRLDTIWDILEVNYALFGLKTRQYTFLTFCCISPHHTVLECPGCRLEKVGNLW